MLNKKQKFDLRHSTDFFKKCQKIFRPEITFFWIISTEEQNDKSECAKVAIIVPKKNFRLATQRNAVKRKIARTVQREIKNWPVDLRLVIVPTQKFRLEQNNGRDWPDFSKIVNKMRYNTDSKRHDTRVV